MGATFSCPALFRALTSSRLNVADDLVLLVLFVCLFVCLCFEVCDCRFMQSNMISSFWLCANAMLSVLPVCL